MFSDVNDDMLLTLQGAVFSLDGSEAVITSLSVDLSVYLDVYSPPEKSSEKEISKDNDPSSALTSTSSSLSSSSSSSSSSLKRRRSMRTFSGIVPGDITEAAMDAAEKLGVDVANRLKELGAGPILKAAKEEVEKGREESERKKREALAKDAAAEEARKRGENIKSEDGNAQVVV